MIGKANDLAVRNRDAADRFAQSNKFLKVKYSTKVFSSHALTSTCLVLDNVLKNSVFIIFNIVNEMKLLQYKIYLIVCINRKLRLLM